MSHKKTTSEIVLNLILTGNVEFFRGALERKTLDINYKNYFGVSLVSLATIYGKPELVRLFLETGEVDIFSRCNQGFSALDYATLSESINGQEILSMLEAEKSRVEELGK